MHIIALSSLLLIKLYEKTDICSVKGGGCLCCYETVPAAQERVGRSSEGKGQENTSNNFKDQEYSIDKAKRP